VIPNFPVHAEASHIRVAIKADIPVLIALEQEASAAAHWSLAQYEAMLSESSPRRIALVTQAHDVIRGFLIARVIGDEWEIENVVVASNARRAGLGTQLVEELRRRARHENANSIALEVRESNVPARALYEKLGFVENGRRRGYYDEPREDGILYQLSFL